MLPGCRAGETQTFEIALLLCLFFTPDDKNTAAQNVSPFPLTTAASELVCDRERPRLGMRCKDRWVSWHVATEERKPETQTVI